MRKFGLLWLGSMALAACGGPAKEDTRTLDQKLESVAAKINDADPAIFGEQYAGKLISSRADGNVLTVRIAGVAEYDNFDAVQAQNQLLPRICGARNFKRVFAEGGEVHFELVSNFGTEYPPVIFNAC